MKQEADTNGLDTSSQRVELVDEIIGILTSSIGTMRRK
jgi:hypothetical protein